jgi:hypothetical protein
MSTATDTSCAPARRCRAMNPRINRSTSLPSLERLGKLEKMERFANWGGCLYLPMRERFALEGSEHTLIPTKQTSISS